jgi:excisionase family DNA binding protein
MVDRAEEPAASGTASKSNSRRRQTDGTAFFTPHQVAGRWSFHPESVRRLVRKGQIAAVILGRRVLIPLAEIQRIENEGRIARAA